MRKIVYVVMALVLAYCTPAETARMVFVQKFQTAIKDNDESAFKSLLFVDTQSESTTRSRLYLSTAASGTVDYPLEFAFDGLKPYLDKMSLVGSRSSIEYGVRDNVEIKSNEDGTSVTKSYSPQKISFWNEKKIVFLEVTLWEASTTTVTEGADPRRPLITHSKLPEFYLGDIKIYEDRL